MKLVEGNEDEPEAKPDPEEVKETKKVSGDDEALDDADGMELVDEANQEAEDEPDAADNGAHTSKSKSKRRTDSDKSSRRGSTREKVGKNGEDDGAEGQTKKNKNAT